MSMIFYRSVKYFTYIEKKTFVAELYVYIDFRLVWILNFLFQNYTKKQVTPLFEHFKNITEDWSQVPSSHTDQ